MVFFDLPVGIIAERWEYMQFRRYLIRSGFMMMQESVYCKLALNMSVANRIMDDIREHKPHSGIIQMLVVTEKQFSRMEFIVGENHSEIIDSDERLIIL